MCFELQRRFTVKHGDFLCLRCRSQIGLMLAQAGPTFFPGAKCPNIDICLMRAFHLTAALIDPAHTKHGTC